MFVEPVCFAGTIELIFAHMSSVLVIIFSSRTVAAEVSALVNYMLHRK